MKIVLFTFLIATFISYMFVSKLNAKIPPDPYCQIKAKESENPSFPGGVECLGVGEIICYVPCSH